MLQVRDRLPQPRCLTALSRSPCILGLLLRGGNLFNESINGNLRSGLEDIPGACFGPFAVSFLFHPSLAERRLYIGNSRAPPTSPRSLASLPPALGISRHSFFPLSFHQRAASHRPPLSSEPN